MNKGITRTEKKILSAALNNGEAGLELFFKKYDPLIKKIVTWPRWHFTIEEQQDAFQTIRTSVQEALPRFKQNSSLKWYIKQIAFYKCVSEIRAQVKYSSITVSTIQRSPDGEWNEMEFADTQAYDPYQVTALEEETKLLHAAIKRLSDTCQTSITMFYLKQMTYQEISVNLGIAVNTVGSRLSKCLNKLHEQLRTNPAFEKGNA